jgi:rare lipoprotein A (peptidoglycan hydrolase)
MKLKDFWQIQTISAFISGLLFGIFIMQCKHLYEIRHKQQNNREIERRCEVKAPVSTQGVFTKEGFKKTAKASWYDRSACFDRKYGYECRTANGEIFNEEAFTMACSYEFPLGSVFRLYYNGKSAKAVCTDRGNFAKYGRTFDLSIGLFRFFEVPSKGVITLEYEKENHEH